MHKSFLCGIFSIENMPLFILPVKKYGAVMIYCRHVSAVDLYPVLRAAARRRKGRLWRTKAYFLVVI